MVLKTHKDDENEQKHMYLEIQVECTLEPRKQNSHIL